MGHGTPGRPVRRLAAVHVSARLPVALLCAFVFGVGAAGCGKESPVGDGDDAVAAPAGPVVTPAEAEAAALPDGLDDDQRGAGAIVLRYARAIAVGNYARGCATRVREERERFEKRAGSCERALLLNFRDKPTELFATIEVGAVRVAGDLAGVDLVQPGQDGVALTLAAQRVRSRWRVVDAPDAQVP